jgi:hypothetical protein
MMAFEEIADLRKGVCYQIGLFLYRKKSKITEFWNCAVTPEERIKMKEITQGWG